MNTEFIDVINAVEDHHEYKDSVKTTYYGVRQTALDTYSKRHKKDYISKKELSKLTEEESRIVAKDYLVYLTEQIDKKTNNNFSKYDKEIRDGVLLMVYNTGESYPMPNTIKSIRENKNKYSIIEAMLSGEPNTSKKALPEGKRGYVNRLYVATKIIAGRNYNDFATAKQVHDLYTKWKTYNETDAMLACVKDAQNAIALSNEQSMQLSNAFCANDNYQPSKNELQSISNTKQSNSSDTQEKPSISENKANKGIISNAIETFSNALTSFGNMLNLTNNDKIDNMNQESKK